MITKLIARDNSVLVIDHDTNRMIPLRDLGDEDTPRWTSLGDETAETYIVRLVAQGWRSTAEPGQSLTEGL